MRMVSVTVDKSPRTLLVACFLAWKALLLTIAIISPQPGYDTSTRLLFKGHGIRDVEVSRPDQYPPPGTQAPAHGLPDLVNRLLLALTRWDTIYFASVAERGYVYEQEWAFGWGFLKLLSFLGTNIPLTTEKLFNVLIHGIILANVSHLISIILLFQLALVLQLSTSNRNVHFAFICAALHIFTPAGIFLVAPCPEAPFALLSFAGYLLYVFSWIDTGFKYHGPIQDLYLILSGVCFGLAATVRGNGLLSGIIYFYDALIWLIFSAEHLLRIRVFNVSTLPPELHAQLRSIRQRRLPATVIAGMLVAIGFAGPQFIAFQQFCGSHVLEKRPWCHAFPPSIYSWVQRHYWDVGFLRYWTLSNLPLFLIALPMLCILLYTGGQVLLGKSSLAECSYEPRMSSEKEAPCPPSISGIDVCVIPIALTQVVLAFAALTSFHVQIISRLSSGYPLWYLIVARDILNGNWTSQFVVRWMFMYALIQAVLFTSFLPPA